MFNFKKEPKDALAQEQLGVPESPISDTETLASDIVLKPIGVLKVEAAEAAWNKKTRWILFIS